MTRPQEEKKNVKKKAKETELRGCGSLPMGLKATKRPVKIAEFRGGKTKKQRSPSASGWTGVGVPWGGKKSFRKPSEKGVKKKISEPPVAPPTGPWGAQPCP